MAVYNNYRSSAWPSSGNTLGNVFDCVHSQKVEAESNQCSTKHWEKATRNATTKPRRPNERGDHRNSMKSPFRFRSSAARESAATARTPPFESWRSGLFEDCRIVQIRPSDDKIWGNRVRDDLIISQNYFCKLLQRMGMKAMYTNFGKHSQR